MYLIVHPSGIESASRKRYADLEALEAVKDEDEVIDHPVIEAFIRRTHRSIYW